MRPGGVQQEKYLLGAFCNNPIIVAGPILVNFMTKGLFGVG